MNLLIFGATGATGLCLVRQALDRGHRVTAFVRDAARLRAEHPALRRVVGDVMQAGDMAQAVPGHDAVLCALGAFPDARADRGRRQGGTPVCSMGTTNIIASMQAQSMRRIVVETAACIGDSRRTGRFGAGHIVHMAMPAVMRDKELQGAALRASGLDWTIVRPTNLKDRPGTGKVRAGEAMRWSLLDGIPHADVATYMLDSLDDPQSIGHAYTVRS